MLSALSSATLLSVLFMIEHTHVLVKILRVGEKEVCHVEMVLCTKWIIMLAFYAQHVKKKREAELTFGIAAARWMEMVIYAMSVCCVVIEFPLPYVL